jgi:DNA-binding response OmpR family regulator
MKILAIEDDQSIIDALGVAFEFRWPEATLVSAKTGREGIDLVRNEHPDIVLLDINLPDTTGFRVLKSVREFSSVPIIILTVRSDDADQLRGLEGGADDYITKPFDYLMLLARVKAVLRRAQAPSIRRSQKVSVSHRLKVDFVNQKVAVDEKNVKLTPVEYRLLVLLVKHKNMVVPYSEIADEVWEGPFDGDTRNIRIYARRLRNKLGDRPPSMIINRHGSGYLFRG